MHIFSPPSSRGTGEPPTGRPGKRWHQGAEGLETCHRTVGHLRKNGFYLSRGWERTDTTNRGSKPPDNGPKGNNNPKGKDDVKNAGMKFLSQSLCIRRIKPGSQSSVPNITWQANTQKSERNITGQSGANVPPPQLSTWPGLPTPHWTHTAFTLS